MKCTSICLLAFCIQVSAGAFSQNITFSGRNVPLQKVFTAIEKQTHYVFFYNDEILRDARPVTLNVKSVSITTVMQECLKGQPLEFSIEDKTIFITKKVVASPVVYVEEVKPPIDVSGRVTDDQGNPLVGANVKVRGSNKGVVTDAEGRFMLKDVEENAVLEISFVGHEMQSVSVRGQKMLSISLAQKLSMLDETVVIAYGTTNRRLNTGNVSTIKSNEISKQPVSNPLLALQGRVPGLFINQQNGIPGTNVRVRIQGQNSIGNGNEPFYVIDGIPYTSTMLPTLSTIFEGTGGSPLSFIDPNNIESIEVLKDADATAIYGSRAANGAILITTKKGKAGKTKIDLTIQQGFGKISNMLDLLDTEQYQQMRLDAKANDNLPILPTDYDLNGTWDKNKSTNWQKELIGGTAKISNFQGSISGGNINTQFLIGATYNRETTVFPGDLSDQKGSMQFSISHNSNNKKLKIQLSGNYLEGQNRLIIGDISGTAITLPPNAPNLYTPAGELNWEPLSNGNSTWSNPLANLESKYNNKTNNLISRFIFNLEILPNLNFNSSFGYTKIESDELSTSPILRLAPEFRSSAQRSASYSNKYIKAWIIEPQFNYHLTRAYGQFDFLIGSTFQENSNKLMSLRGSGYNSDAELENIRSASTINVTNSIISSYKYNAIFSRLTYNLKNRYLVNLSTRRDGSSRFGDNNLFQNFYAIGSSWIISDEQFFKSITKIISFTKIKASYGTTGNDQIGDYSFMSLYNPLNPGVAYGGSIGLVPLGHANPYLQWEETKKTNLGIDIGLLKNRVLIGLNYFSNKSSNQLLYTALPIVTGFTDLLTNLPATVKNYGVEFTLNSDIIRNKKFQWLSNFNLTITKNKLVRFDGLDENVNYNNTLFIGYPINTYKVYNLAGVDESTGLYQFINNKGQAVSIPIQVTDQKTIINALPELYGGFQNTVSYNRLELDFLIQFVNQKRAGYTFGNLPGFSYNQPISSLNYWKQPGDVVPFKKVSTKTVDAAYSAARTSQLNYNNGSYIRLKNISLSYRIPEDLIQRIKLNECRIFIHCQNILTITKYDGLDPETGMALPVLKILTAGIKISL